jgi:hypothetical protein
MLAVTHGRAGTFIYFSKPERKIPLLETWAQMEA